MEKVDVSVVIPFYNNKKWLLEAIKSVEEQTVMPIEVIIIDDGSKEDLSDIKSNILKIIIYKQSNKGAASARNLGIFKAKGKYIAFLDSDDYWHKNKLEIQYDILSKYNAIWSIHSYKKFDTNLNLAEEKEIKYRTKKIYPQIVNSCPIATPSVMVKRSVLLKNNYFFNENLKYGEDYCLWLKLAEKYSVIVIDNNLCYVRMHGNNAACSSSVQLKSRPLIWKYIKEDSNLSKNINIFTRFLYKVCELECKLIKGNNTYYENLAKILYFIPRSLFKIIYFLSDRNEVEQ